MGPGTALAGPPTHAIPDYQYGEDDGEYPPERRRRTWLWWLIGALLVLAVVAAVGYAILGGGGTSGKTVPSVINDKQATAVAAVKHAGLVPVVVTKSNNTVAKGIVYSTNPAVGTVAPAGSKVTLFVSGGKKKVTVPPVVHLSVSDATSKLQAAGFKVKQQTAQNSSASPNTVVRQDPGGGTTALFGSTVTIFVSPGGQPVPDVTGMNYQLAEGKLNNAGFQNIQIVHVTDTGVPDGTVVNQRPHATRVVSPNTTITLFVVQNPTPTPTPTPTPSGTPTPTPSTTPSTPPPGDGITGTLRF
jgi:serine/threonine-protein kinase